MPLILSVIVGLAGGLVLAMILAWWQRTPAETEVVRREPLSTDVINMAHIKVAGVGGLGLIATGIIVAVYIPSIGRPLLAGVSLGALLAFILIVRRRQTGPIPSRSERGGANTVFSIDTVVPSDEEKNRSGADPLDLVAAPAPFRS